MYLTVMYHSPSLEPKPLSLHQRHNHRSKQYVIVIEPGISHGLTVGTCSHIPRINKTPALRAPSAKHNDCQSIPQGIRDEASWQEVDISSIAVTSCNSVVYRIELMHNSTARALKSVSSLQS